MKCNNLLHVHELKKYFPACYNVIFLNLHFKNDI